MKLEIRKEIKNLYYIRCRAGVGHHEKTFVRVLKKMANGTCGSKMYCSSRDTALLFETPEDAYKLKNQYNTSYSNVAEYDFEKHTPNYKKENYILEEIEVKGVKCYRFIRK